MSKARDPANINGGTPEMSGGLFLSCNPGYQFVNNIVNLTARPDLKSQDRLLTTFQKTLKYGMLTGKAEDDRMPGIVKVDAVAAVVTGPDGIVRRAQRI